MRWASQSAHFVGNSMGAINLFVDATSESPLLPARSLVMICGGGEIQRNEHSAALYDYDATLSGMRRIVEALFFDPAYPERRRVRAAALRVEHRARRMGGVGGRQVPQARIWSRRHCRRASGRTSASPCRRWWSRGRATNYCPDGWAAEIAKQISRGRSAVIERAGHCPQIEQPDAVNELLLDFLGDAT